MANVKIGLCGFTIPIAKYPQLFPMVEVQQTFYQPPADGVLRRWRTTMPPEFEFTIKAWQLITHTAKSPTYRKLKRELTDRERAESGAFRSTAIVNEGWRVTLACAEALKATSILFQCPASFRPTDENISNLDAFFGRIDRPTGVRLLWEPRGPWPAERVATICADHDLIHVVDPFVERTVTRGMTYFRLHGDTGARHIYTDEELIRLRALIPVRGETYVLFNNIPRFNDAVRFGELIGGGLVTGADE